MAGLREQALLEVMFEAADVLRGFDRVESRGKKAADTLDKEFDQVDLDSLRGEADQLISKVVELGDRGDKAFDELRRSVERAGTELQGSDRVAAELRIELDRLRLAQQQIGLVRSLPVLEQQLRDAQARAALLRIELQRVQREERETGEARGSRKLQEELRESTIRARLLAAQIGRVRKEEQLMGVGTGAATLGARLTAARAAALGLIVALASAVIVVRKVGGAILDVAANFEQLRLRLETFEGSEEAAERAFDRISEFAQRTPFEIDSITDAWARLRAVGIEPNERLLAALGDIAAASGKDILQVTEAVNDAIVGEFERLKEFGIVARSEGDRVRFTFAGVTKEVGKNATEIQQFLTDLAESNFGGAMERQSRSVVGALSNLKDAASQAADQIGESGLTAAVIDSAIRLRELIENSEGTAQALGQVLGGSVTGTTDLFEAFIEKLDETRQELQVTLSVLSLLTGGSGDTRTATLALNEALIDFLGVLERSSGPLDVFDVALRAAANRLREAGTVSTESTQVQEESLRKLVAAYDRAGREVPGFVQKMVEEAGASLEQLRAGVEQTADSFEEQMARIRTQQEQFVEGIEGDLEKTQQKYQQLVNYVMDVTEGDLRNATEVQLKEILKLAESVEEGYQLLGEKLPEEVATVVKAVERQLKVIEDKRQQQIDLAKAVADAEEESAKRQVKAAEDVAKAQLGGELTEDAKAAAQEAERLGDRLKEVGEELKRLDQQPLDAQQLATYNGLVDESLALQRQLRDAQREATEVTVAQGSEIDKLSQEQREQAEAMADLLRLNKDYKAGSGQVIDALEEIRISTLLAGTQQQSYRQELAGTVEGWDKLTAAQQEQLEQQLIFGKESKRLIRELREEVEKESVLIVEAQDKMASSMANYVKECERAHACLSGLA